jgi:hypothetical protein
VKDRQTIGYRRKRPEKDKRSYDDLLLLPNALADTDFLTFWKNLNRPLSLEIRRRWPPDIRD